MTEAQHTAKFVAEMRKKHPEWLILKFNDRSTKGIPDLAMSNGVKTLWIECKTPKTPRPELQRYMLQRLGGIYLFFDGDKKYITDYYGVQIRMFVEEYIQCYLM